MCFLFVCLLFLLLRSLTLVVELLLGRLHLLKLLTHEVLQVGVKLLLAKCKDLIVVKTRLRSFDLIKYCRHHLPHARHLTRQVLRLVTDTAEFVSPSNPFFHTLVSLRFCFALGS